jgi:hypothetical protein
MLSLWLTWPGEIENHLMVWDQMVQRALLTHIGDVHRDAIGDAFDVEEVCTRVGNQRVDDQDFGAELDKRPRQVAADEPQPTGDHHTATAVEGLVIQDHSGEGSC